MGKEKKKKERRRADGEEQKAGKRKCMEPKSGEAREGTGEKEIHER